MSDDKKNSLMVTVAIPVYNGKKFIRNAIDSILKQRNLVKSIFVIDDASNDGIDDIIKEYQSKTEIIEYYKNPTNLGYPKNWNNCFYHCKTKYLIILHQDDELTLNSIEKLINFIQNHPDVALVGGLEDFIDEKGRLISKSHTKETKIFQKGQIYEFVKETGSYIPCSSVMFDMEKIRNVGFFDENYLATDELFWPKVLTKFPIAILGESLILRRIHPEQTEYSDFANKFDKIIEAAKEQYHIASYEENLFQRRKTLKILQEKASRNCIRIAYKVFKTQKDFYTALRYLKVAWKEYPKIFFSKFFIKFSIKAILGKIH
ncbi:glycosyltransferase family 2 protein [Melioribacter sp. Ez-97]|uniref:glycosyltransferase family 2 protein n=1 Tax=Melioribacter sp. Ez-97 TaxID=3423434 RepID=UPI003ED84F09